MQTKLLVALSCLAILTLPSGTSAHTERRGDGNDTRGGLDLKRVHLSHNSTHIFIRMKTHQTWRRAQLAAPNSMRVWFKKRNRTDVYFEVRTWYRRGRLQARVHKAVGASGYLPRGKARARKVGPRSLLVTVRRKQVHVPNKPVWFVTSLWYRGPCQETVCTDFAPNSGRYHH
jgi:hypothetical protein